MGTCEYHCLTFIRSMGSLGENRKVRWLRGSHQHTKKWFSGFPRQTSSSKRLDFPLETNSNGYKDTPALPGCVWICVKRWALNIKSHNLDLLLLQIHCQIPLCFEWISQWIYRKYDCMPKCTQFYSRFVPVGCWMSAPGLFLTVKGDWTMGTDLYIISKLFTAFLRDQQAFLTTCKWRPQQRSNSAVGTKLWLLWKRSLTSRFCPVVHWKFSVRTLVTSAFSVNVQLSVTGNGKNER